VLVVRIVRRRSCRAQRALWDQYETLERLNSVLRLVHLLKWEAAQLSGDFWDLYGAVEEAQDSAERHVAVIMGLNGALEEDVLAYSNMGEAFRSAGWRIERF